MSPDRALVNGADPNRSHRVPHWPPNAAMIKLPSKQGPWMGGGLACLLASLAQAQAQEGAKPAPRTAKTELRRPAALDLQKPLYLAARSSICSSKAAVEDPNQAPLIAKGECAITERRIKVALHLPFKQALDAHGNLAQTVQVDWQTSAKSYMTTYSGWAVARSLEN